MSTRQRAIPPHSPHDTPFTENEQQRTVTVGGWCVSTSLCCRHAVCLFGSMYVDTLRKREGDTKRERERRGPVGMRDHRVCAVWVWGAVAALLLAVACSTGAHGKVYFRETFDGAHSHPLPPTPPSTMTSSLLCVFSSRCPRLLSLSLCDPRRRSVDRPVGVLQPQEGRGCGRRVPVDRRQVVWQQGQ